MTNPQVRAIVGARVSHMQGQQKVSHLDQSEVGVKEAARRGWEVVDAFEDLDVSAISMSPWQRPDLAEWLTDREHEWDALIFAKTDRVFRSAKDCADLADWCEKHKKILVIVEDGIVLDYFHSRNELDGFADAMSKIFLMMAAMFAEIEGRRFVQRARARVRYLKPTDRWGYGQAPFGFRVVDHPSGAGKALDHDPKEQAILHEAADLVLEGNSLRNTASILTKRERPTPRVGRRTDKKELVAWRPLIVKTLLTSMATQGVKVSKEKKPILDKQGEPILVGPPSFRPEVWSEIQTMIEERELSPSRRVHSSNPILGIGVCSKCWKNLRQRTLKKGDKEYRYYLCDNETGNCSYDSWRADDVDELVSQTFLAECGDMKQTIRKFDQGSDHTAELATVEATIAALREDRELGLYSSPEDIELFRSQTRALIERRDKLQTLPSRKAGWVFEETDKTYADAWQEADAVARRKMMVDAGVRFVLIDKKTYKLEMPKDPRQRLMGQEGR